MCLDKARAALPPPPARPVAAKPTINNNRLGRATDFYIFNFFYSTYKLRNIFSISLAKIIAHLECLIIIAYLPFLFF
jgi:hypothetical protein